MAMSWWERSLTLWRPGLPAAARLLRPPRLPSARCRSTCRSPSRRRTRDHSLRTCPWRTFQVHRARPEGRRDTVITAPAAVTSRAAFSHGLTPQWAACAARVVSSVANACGLTVGKEPETNEPAGRMAPRSRLSPSNRSLRRRSGGRERTGRLQPDVSAAEEARAPPPSVPDMRRHRDHEVDHGRANSIPIGTTQLITSTLSSIPTTPMITPATHRPDDCAATRTLRRLRRA